MNYKKQKEVKIDNKSTHLKWFAVIFLILILLTNLSFASYSTVTMNVVEEPVCTIELGENSKFEKKLISKDLNNKEVTI